MKLMRSAVAPHIDYGFLYGIDKTSPKFVPSDIDGVIERNGVFLFLEWKQFLEDMQEGQEKMLMALAKKPDVFVVKIIGHTTHETPVIEEFSLLKNNQWVSQGTTITQFYEFYKRWLTYATNKK
jgi:hypothetical protein